MWCISIVARVEKNNVSRVYITYLLHYHSIAAQRQHRDAPDIESHPLRSGFVMVGHSTLNLEAMASGG